MTIKVYSIEEMRQKLIPIFEKYGLLKASLFGSYARDEAKSDSDVDLLIYLDESFELEKYLRFETSLKRVLKKKVDVVEYRCINGFMRDDIMKEAILLYECEGQKAASYNN